MHFFLSAPTNILNMLVFTKHGLTERINLCLFFQSLADLAFMSINFLLYADRMYLGITNTTSRGPLTRFFTRTHLLGLYGFYWASGFMTMVIACERCLCVVSPLRSQNILNTRSTFIITLVAFFLILGGAFVIGMRWSLTCVFDSRTNSSYLQAYPGEFYLLNRPLVDTLDGVVYGIVLPGTFVVTVIISTVVTVSKLKRMASWREKTSSAAMSVRDVSLTRMLIGCSILFIVCTVPGVVFRVLILFVTDMSLAGRYYNTFKFIFSVTHLCAYTNSSVNFFIYCTMGTKYKQTLKSMCCKIKKPKPVNNTYTKTENDVDQ